MTGGKRVVLFTPYSPRQGGGAANLRSLIPHLDGFHVDWLYTAAHDQGFPGAICVGPPMAGGSLAHDLGRTVALWSRVPTRRLRATVAALRAHPADGYWVVGHNEGVLVARALARLGAPVHLTIQDDVPDGMMARSTRYRYLAALARPTYYAALRQVRSLDFTSDGMKRYYAAALGLDGEVIHPFVPALLPPAAPPARPPGQLVVGHLGTIYAAAEWRAFLAALVGLARRRGLVPRMIMVGLAAKYRAVAAEFPGVVELVADLPEDEAVARLAAADVLYAMYPFDARADVFRRTSLPTKLSSYLRCRRPIVAHAPRDTSLGDIVERYGLGQKCDSLSPPAIEAAIAAALDASVPDARFETAREEVYGRVNVRRMAACLTALCA